jgi:Helitron helicase-like domain at N-terminus/PIF1-like helicase
MYLLYDVLQLRRSSLGNSLLVKRRDWESAERDIASLTVDQLQEAAKAISEGRLVENPTILRLQRSILTIGMQVPESYAQKLKRRSEIKGLIARYGMPAFWLTINPADLKNPLVLQLAGITYSADTLPAAAAAIREATATSNPVAVAEFFHHTCNGIFKGLLGTDTGRIGILGEVANHFGVVETNGRGMLHLHGLIWLTGNLAFRTLRDRLLQDEPFAARMIRYLQSAICQSIELCADADTNTDLPPSAKDPETDREFHVRLTADSNAVASKKQLHSSKHNATCFKYAQSNTGKRACRFGMPRELVPTASVDEFGVVHLARNHEWINPWNPAIATCIRSNHDISWVPTMAKTLSLIYYLTNYATKDDVSPQQILVKAALLKRTIESAKAAVDPTADDLRIRMKDMDQFALRCFNTLSHDREISGVQIASSLLQLPDHYTENDNFVQVNLWWLRHHVRATMESTAPSANDSTPLDDEQCVYQPGDKVPSSRFDNYNYRGPLLSDLSFFEYHMLVQSKRKQDSTQADIEFDPAHPRSDRYIQRLATKKSQVLTVTFNGQLSQFQAEEDTIRGGHAATEAIRNDIAEVLLGLFVPWDRLPLLFQQHAATYPVKRDACSQIWDIVEPTLAPHNRDFANNIEMLRKSKEDCQIDAALRRNDHSQDFFDQEIDDVALANLEADDEALAYEGLSSESLVAAYHSIARSSYRDFAAAAQHYPGLLADIHPAPVLRARSLLPLDIFRLPSHASSGLQYFPPATLQRWQLQLKIAGKADDPDDDPAPDMDDFNLDSGDGILHPALAPIDSIPNLADRRQQVGENPTAATLIDLIIDDIPLNTKQRLIVERVLSAALSWNGAAYDASKRDQTFLYVGGNAGVGKSQIITAIVAAMDLLYRKDEVLLTAPTGSAADHIDGNTYHSALGISLAKSQKPTVSPRVRKLLSNKTIMFVDEISMVDLSMLSTINDRCNIARSLDRSSTDLFGGIPIIIVMGDFYQFPPVKGTALWKEPRKGNAEDEKGLWIWHQFTNVIILHEQMRQAQDPGFRDFLDRVRTTTCTEDDVAMLNSKAITSLFTPELEDTTSIVRKNTLRHHLNRIQMEHFARSRGQRIYIFPALHSRTKSTSLSAVHAEELLRLPDQGANIPFPGLFFYTSQMPATVLTNSCTLMGLVNGARGIATGVVVDPTGTFSNADG